MTMYEDEEFNEDLKSKTQVKQEMKALKDLGVELTHLTKDQLARIPLDDKLRSAIEESPKITANSAKKRHEQFIGKLIRNADYEAIEAAYEEIKEASHRAARLHHVIEDWRDELIKNGSKLEGFIESYPNTDRQQLRALLRSISKAKPGDTSGPRKLFRFIRDTINTAE